MPPHPGEFINSVYMEPHGISCGTVADYLGVLVSKVNRLVNAKSPVTAEMALRLSKVFGRTPESWLSLQNNHGLWLAKQNVNLENIQPIDLPVTALQL